MCSASSVQMATECLLSSCVSVRSGGSLVAEGGGGVGQGEGKAKQIFVYEELCSTDLVSAKVYQNWFLLLIEVLVHVLCGFLHEVFI